MNFKKTFKNKKVLITGHTGFKGAWLTLWLLHCGAKIMGISKDIPTQPSLFNTLNLKKKIIDKKIDLKNIKILKREVKKFQPDFIFHLAAQSLVKKSLKNPYLTWMSNSLGTINILESLRNIKIKKKIIAIMITSDKSYKNIEIKRGYVESDRLGGIDPYSASKASAELALKSYINTFFKNKKKNIVFGIARAGNVIGGGDWADDRLIPDCMKSWNRKEMAKIRNPKSTRPWQHVIEAICGYLIFAQKLKINSKLNGEVFNFGPDNKNNFSVINLIKELEKNNLKLKWKIVEEKNNIESNLLKINSNKAKNLLRWKCILSFKETINYLAEWYKEYYNKKNMYSFTINQIYKYEKKLLKYF
tara:strand:+ start:3189 stop:4268 length:1080 start_codon:yes stop_codon:yes gene_type:complete